jgi:RsmE family RNA methyltransferase
MQISGPQEIGSLPGQLLIAEQTGAACFPEGLDTYTILIGPEGGFAADELPAGVPRISFSDRTLRTDTAAILAAGLVLK